MSFDLHFYFASERRPASWEALFAWADEQGHFTRRALPDGAFQLWYSRPDTGVYFSLTQESPPPLRATHGMAPAYLHFNLNYARPRFFALESDRIVASLSERFGLVAYDPQLGRVVTPSAGQLVESWMPGNRHAVQAMRGMGQRLPSMDSRSAEAFWRYRDAFSRRKRELGDEYFVPQLVAVEWNGSVVGLATLTKPTMYVLPPADLLVIDRNGEKCAVPMSAVQAGIGRFLKREPDRPELGAVHESTLFGRGVMDEWDHFYASAPVCARLAELRGIEPEGFVDEPV